MRNCRADSCGEWRRGRGLAVFLLAKLRDEADKAPVVKALDGKKVRIAGFTVTLERNDQGVTEFLLVPYYGACIHTPPPANQIVHVRAGVPVCRPSGPCFRSG